MKVDGWNSSDMYSSSGFSNHQSPPYQNNEYMNNNAAALYRSSAYRENPDTAHNTVTAMNSTSHNNNDSYKASNSFTIDKSSPSFGSSGSFSASFSDGRNDSTAAVTVNAAAGDDVILSPPPRHITLRFGARILRQDSNGSSGISPGSNIGNVSFYGRSNADSSNTQEEHRSLALGCGHVYNIFQGGFAAYASRLDTLIDDAMGQLSTSTINNNSTSYTSMNSDMAPKTVIEDHGAKNPRSITVDADRGLIITGHQDGKVRFWRPPNDSRNSDTKNGSSSSAASDGNYSHSEYGNHHLDVFIRTNSGDQSSGTNETNKNGLIRKLSATNLESVGSVLLVDQLSINNGSKGQSQGILMKSKLENYVDNATSEEDDTTEVLYRNRSIGNAAGIPQGVGSDENCKVLSFVAHRSPVSALSVVRVSTPLAGSKQQNKNTYKLELWTGARSSMRYWDIDALLRGEDRNIYSSKNNANINANTLQLANGSRRIHSVVKFIVTNEISGGNACSLVFSGGSAKVFIWDATSKASLCALTFDGSRTVSHIHDETTFDNGSMDAPSVLSAGFTMAANIGDSSLTAFKRMGQKTPSGKQSTQASNPPTSKSNRKAPTKRGFFSRSRGNQLIMEDDDKADSTNGSQDLQIDGDSNSSSFMRKSNDSFDSNEFEEDNGVNGEDLETEDTEYAGDNDGLLNKDNQRQQQQNQQLTCMLSSPEGIIFSIFSSGLIVISKIETCLETHTSTISNVQYLAKNEKIKSGSKVTCACIPFEGRLWLGTSSGFIIVISYTSKTSTVTELTKIGCWHPNEAKNNYHYSNKIQCYNHGTDAVVSMTTDNDAKLIFCLYKSGALIAYRKESPWRGDSIVEQIITNSHLTFTSTKKLNVVVGSWNVNEKKAGKESLSQWMSTTAHADIAVVCLQEVEMSSSSMMYQAAAKTMTKNMNMSNRKASLGSSATNATSWWLHELDDVINNNARPEFQMVAMKELGGMVIAMWIRKTLLRSEATVSPTTTSTERDNNGSIDLDFISISSVATGVGDVLGNKGGVAVAVTIYNKKICFLNSHLAAHRNAVEKRNGDFTKIVNKMYFDIGNYKSQMSFDDADLCVWAGDLNYRIDEFTYEYVCEEIRNGNIHKLLSQDQLNKERYANRVFQQFFEAPIKFNPTYKFDKNSSDPFAYDSSEKKRVPAWCDRILVKDSITSLPPQFKETGQPLPACRVQCQEYASLPSINDSDHKPIRAALTVFVGKENEISKRHIIANAFVEAYDLIDDVEEEIEEVQLEEDEPPPPPLLSF